jgi:peptidoglycan/LPS O-acetylase OafA/YrhL
MTRKIGLDVVRAGAISLVLIAHFAKCLDFLGIYGVELFFALSGFLIGGILYRRLTTCNRWTFDEVKLFWFRRWWRTLPNYYLFLAVSVPFHYYIGGLPTIIGFFPFLAFCQNLFSVHSTFYGVSWSLCVEEWFYFLFPLCILFFISLNCSKRTAFICTTLLFLIFPPVLREFMFVRNDPAIVRMMTIPRLDALFYGVATSFVLARHRVSAAQKIALLAIAFVGLIALFIFQHHCYQNNFLVPFYRTAFVVLPICFSLTLPFFASVDRLPGCAFLTRPIANLSLWSYSIYLSHIPILFATYAMFGELRDNAIVNALSKVAGLLLCLAASCLLYKHWESKLMALRPNENRTALGG